MKHYTIKMSTDNDFDDDFLMSDLGTGLDGNFEIYEYDVEKDDEPWEE